MNQKEKRNNFIFLLKIYLQHAKRWFFVVCLSTLVSPLLAYMDVVLLRDAVDFLTLNGKLNLFIVKMIIWLLLYFAIIVINSLIETYFGENKNTLISNQINKKIYKKVLDTDYKFFDKTEFYNDYTWTLNNFYSQVFSSARVIWQLLMSFFTIGTIGTLMLTMDYMVVIFVLTNVAVEVLLNNMSAKISFQKNRESTFFQRVLGYIHRIFYVKDYAMGIKTTNIKNTLLNKYDESTEGLSNIVKKYRGKITLISILSTGFTYTIKVATILWLVWRVYNSKVSLGEFTALFYASIQLKIQLDKFSNLLTSLKNLNLYTKGINDFFSLESSIENNQNGENVPSGALSIDFRNVNFKYIDEGDYVLNDLTFDIKAGEKIAIVGANGAGKSTIVKLILRLYDANEGDVFVGGANIKNVDLEQLRYNIGVAFQDSVLYAFDVKENLSVYETSLSTDRAKEITKKLGLDVIFAKKGATLNSYLTRELDEKGIEFSGGERQLIAIARLLSRQFGLLIFDEPSASLDPVYEHQLSKMIMNDIEDTTVILISHRLSSVIDADKIIVIEDGRVIESGQHDELMSLQGKYYSLFNLQAQNYINRM